MDSVNPLTPSAAYSGGFSAVRAHKALAASPRLRNLVASYRDLGERFDYYSAAFDRIGADATLYRRNALCRCMARTADQMESVADEIRAETEAHRGC